VGSGVSGHFFHTEWLMQERWQKKSDVQIYFGIRQEKWGRGSYF
jgi:hypothetical protein